MKNEFRPLSLTRRVVLAGMASAMLLGSGLAQAAELQPVRISMVTGWWPNVIAVAAEKLGFFEKEGIKAEITFYKGGGPSFEALAAGAADINCNGAYMVALGRSKGIDTKIVGTTATNYAGWHLLVPKGSKIQSPADLAGKKVGISANGSISDFLALWTEKKQDVNFTRVPLGGGGMLPSLMAGNVDAVVLWSPQSIKALQDGNVQSLVDYGEAVEPDLNAAWIVTEKMLQSRPDAVQGSLNALYGAVKHLKDNKDFAIDLIVELDGVSKDIAAEKYRANVLTASDDGLISAQAVERSIELGKAGGLSITVPASETFVDQFKPNPTR